MIGNPTLLLLPLLLPSPLPPAPPCSLLLMPGMLKFGHNAPLSLCGARTPERTGQSVVRSPGGVLRPALLLLATSLRPEPGHWHTGPLTLSSHCTCEAVATLLLGPAVTTVAAAAAAGGVAATAALLLPMT
jgi:hypothetical protein